jgi:queuosine precursor transporter
MIYVAFMIYAAAMVGANLSIAYFGPASAPINAFVLIGLDLTMRDWLHVRLKWWQLLALIVATGALTYALNPAAGMIAVASSCAFTAAALADWAAFSRLRGSWMLRANGSNVAGAAVDSVVFLALAPFPFSWAIAAQMIVAKVLGGAMWAWLLNRRAVAPA